MSLKGKIAEMRKHLRSSGDENVKAFGSSFIFISLSMIGVIAFFLDIIFVTMIWNALPGGFLRIFAAGGAILVSPVVILILLAKLYYFRKGGQLIFSYIAFGVDIAFAALNTYCAFQIAWGNTSDVFVVTWRDLSPITPCVILALLAVLILLDPNAKRHNQEREYAEKERDLELHAQYEDKERQFALRQLDLELQAAQQEAAIEVKTQALEEYKTFLKEEILSADALAELREGARRLRIETIHAVTGLARPITQLPSPVPPAQQPYTPVQHAGGQPPVQLPPALPTHVPPPGTTVSPPPQEPAQTGVFQQQQQPFSPTEMLEHLYKQNPQGFDQVVEQIRQQSQPPQSPFAQPHLVPNPGQAGATTNNGTNGHQKNEATKN